MRRNVLALGVSSKNSVMEANIPIGDEIGKGTCIQSSFTFSSRMRNVGDFGMFSSFSSSSNYVPTGN